VIAVVAAHRTFKKGYSTAQGGLCEPFQWSGQKYVCTHVDFGRSLLLSTKFLFVCSAVLRAAESSLPNNLSCRYVYSKIARVEQPLTPFFGKTRAHPYLSVFPEKNLHLQTHTMKRIRRMHPPAAAAAAEMAIMSVRNLPSTTPVCAAAPGSSVPSRRLQCSHSTLAHLLSAAAGFFVRRQLLPTLLVLLLRLQHSASAATTPTTTTFCAMGDIPYDAYQARLLEQEMLHNVPTTCKFVIHVGDLRSSNGTQNCTRQKFQMVADILILSPVPVFVLLGDNDWNGRLLFVSN
jgi:hypothetical protein